MKTYSIREMKTIYSKVKTEDEFDEFTELVISQRKIMEPLARSKFLLWLADDMLKNQTTIIRK